MSGESSKRLRAEPKNYNLNRNYTVKRQRSDSTHYKRRIKDYGVQTTIVDSGAFTIKYGTSNDDSPVVMPNCIIKAKAERKRPFIGNQIEDCRDLSGLYYLLPCERGYVTKWDVQKPVWDYVFHKNSIEENCVIMTQPMFNFKSIQDCMDEIMFEEYEVQSLVRANPTDLAYYNYIRSDKNDQTPSCLVVDSGYSFSHIVPYIDGRKYSPKIIRIDIGGKLLTNYMKDIISYRQLHVMEETYVINQVKEDSCFVSLDLRTDMKLAQQSGDKNTIIRNYVLPDFNNIRRGYIQEPGSSLNEIAEGCQILRLNNERFTVPELLLHPSNIGMDCMGLAEAIAKCIKNCPLKYQAALAQNIVLIGGNANIPGYKERIYSDVRSMLPYYFPMNIIKPDDPIGFAWQGGKVLSKSPILEKLVVMKHEYEEYGSSITFKRFNNMKASISEDTIKEENVKPFSLLSHINRSIFGKHDLEEEELAKSAEGEKSLTSSPLVANKDTEDKAPEIEKPVPPNKITLNPCTVQIPKIDLTIDNNTPKATVQEPVVNLNAKNGLQNLRNVKSIVTLEDIFKVAGRKDIKICSAPGLSIPIQTNQNMIRFIAPNNMNQQNPAPMKQLVRIHYPQTSTIVKNIPINPNQKLLVPTSQSVLRLPMSRAQTLNGQQITFLQNNKQIITQLPISTNSAGNQIIRLNYTVPKLATRPPPVSEPSGSVLKDLYPAPAPETKDKTVVLVKQVFLKKN